jgi:glutamate formiminotransferase / 5-formyltetrahydrofolate cyclo-ligase
MNEAVIECVPNFSEGIDRDKVRAIVNAMQVDGVALLDWSMDSDHNRSVVTIAGPPQAVVEAAVRAAGKASQVIDLTQQHGVHPRIGAADVIPFVPVSGISLPQCAVYAREAGRAIWDGTACRYIFMPPLLSAQTVPNSRMCAAGNLRAYANW